MTHRAKYICAYAMFSLSLGVIAGLSAMPAKAQDLPSFLLDESSLNSSVNSSGQNTQSQAQDADNSFITPIAEGALEEGQTEEELKEEAREEAFDAALQGLLPLKPNEIRKLLEHFDRTQEAVELPVYPSPKPEIAVENISLDPGAPPSVIKTAYGHVTTLNFLDLSGNPWPIQDISWAGNFEIIEGATKSGAHVVRISPQSDFARGNISIRLLEFKTPVIMSLETSRDSVHYRFDAIIGEYGPYGETPIIDKGLSIAAGGKDISSVLQGIAPAGSEKLTVEGVDGRTSAYRSNGTVFVRTPLTLLSPGWNSSVSSADGMHVYEIPDTPVLLLSQNGKMVRARLTEDESIFDDENLN